MVGLTGGCGCSWRGVSRPLNPRPQVHTTRLEPDFSAEKGPHKEDFGARIRRQKGVRALGYSSRERFGQSLCFVALGEALTKDRTSFSCLRSFSDCMIQGPKARSPHKRRALTRTFSVGRV